MPIYVYEILDDAGAVVGQCEFWQKVSDAPYEKHPETGQAVARIIQAPFVGGSWSDSSMKKSVSDDKKLDRLGFTKYVKAGDGVYEKRAGKGPKVITRDQPISGSDLKGN